MRRTYGWYLFVCLSGVCHFARAGEIVYVKADAKDGGDGSSWSSAFRSLTSALDKAEPGDEVWVAAGVYRPTDSADRFVAFRPRPGVACYGGFAGTEKDRAARDWSAHDTVLSGDVGEAGRHRDNVYHIVEIIDAPDPPRLDGFVLVRAHNNCACPNNRGGGAYVLRSSAVFANCTLFRNRAGGGGAMWIEDSVVTVENCFIRNNRNRAITSTIFSDVTFRNCRFVRNRVLTEGGAIGAFNGSVTTAFNCLFLRNSAVGRDGGAYFGRADGVFANCVFVSNTADEWGGALRQYSGPLTVINCSFTDNGTRFWAGGISALFECTISGSVLYGNVGARRQGEDAQMDFFETPPVITDCLVEGWTGRWGGEGNFDGDPKWIDAGGGNLRIAGDSPCIDAGDNDTVTEAVDLDGNPRILGGRVDIGAYENVCREVIDLAASMVEDDAEGHVGDGDGVCEPGEDCVLTATVAVDAATMPDGSTVRVSFMPVDENGDPDPDPCCAEHTCGPDARCPKVRKARIDAAGQGTATLRGCAGGPWTVCVEGCGESLCREVGCP